MLIKCVVFSNMADTIRSLATCPVCEVFRPTQTIQCGNGHLLCTQCETRLPQKRCPTCRDELRPNRCLLVQKLAEELKIEYDCPDGCGVQVTCDNRERHLLQCVNRTCVCPWACGQRVSVTSFLQHARLHHPWCIRTMDGPECTVAGSDIDTNNILLFTDGTDSVVLNILYDDGLVVFLFHKTMTYG